MSEISPREIGPYRIESLLGRGGMGEVYKAYHRRLDRWVAIKHVRPDAAEKVDNPARFRREARTAAHLSHPSIVQVYDLIEDGDGGDWIVMEYLEGPTVADLLETGPLDVDLALAYGQQIAEGLAEAHKKGIVHRDLKAENVIVSSSGHAKMVDFGLAKRVFDGDGEASISIEGAVMGTGRSMSPEQARGLEVGPRSDLFSLGVLLYEMLTGTSPFQAETLLDTLTRVATHQQPPARQLNPRVSPEVSALIDRLLQKAPDLRPASADRVAAVLQAIRISYVAATLVDGPLLDDETEIEDAGSANPSSAAMEARLRTVLVTDLVDSTALVSRLGDRRAVEILERHDTVARALLADHHGQEIDKSDGFLLLFRRPIDAVAYALAYHQALEDLARDAGIELAARAGIHLGELFLRENTPTDVARGAKPLEVEGLAKVMAARVASLAGARQTLITRAAYELARRASVSEGLALEGVTWLRHGAYELKGVEEPVAIYEVGVPGRAPLAIPEGATKAVRLEDHAGVEADVPGYGATAARTDPGPHERWRIAAGLVVAVVAAGGFVALVPEARQYIKGQRQDTLPEVQARAETLTINELYDQGMELLRRFDQKGNIDKAIASFQRMLDQDTESAAAYAGLARAYWRKYRHSGKDPAFLQHAQQAAERGVELGQYLADARVSRGLVYHALGRGPAAIEEFETALELEPSADAHAGLADVYASQGESERAEAAYLQAIRLRPLDRLFHDELGAVYFNTGRYDLAEASYRKSTECAPDSIFGYRNLANVYIQQGRYNEANQELQKALRIRESSSLLHTQGTVFYYRGFYQDAARAYERALEIGGASNDYTYWHGLADAYRQIANRENDAYEAYSRAISLVKEKLELKPESTALRVRLALYLARRGDSEQALLEAESIDSLLENDASTLYWAVQVYEASGERTKALEALEHALLAGYSLDEVKKNPELFELRADKRFHRLLGRISA